MTGASGDWPAAGQCHYFRHLPFNNRIGSGRAQSRQQAAGSAEPKEPTACKLVGTVRGTKLWAGDCVGVELLKGPTECQNKQPRPVRRSKAAPCLFRGRLMHRIPFTLKIGNQVLDAINREGIEGGEVELMEVSDLLVQLFAFFAHGAPRIC